MGVLLGAGHTEMRGGMNGLALQVQRVLARDPHLGDHDVASLEELVRCTVRPAITLEVVAAGGLWTTLVGPPQLESALLNVCINARHAMPDGDRPSVETANRLLDAREARERDVEPGRYMSLWVSDTGPGMTPDVIARAFHPFFTTKPTGIGTVLGLSMVYGFVRQSGGQVQIYSEPGQGTMVFLHLPRHLGAAEVEGITQAPEVPRVAAGKTALVVDDESTVRMLVAEVLKNLGYSAIEATDGTAGLQILQSAARMDLLIPTRACPAA